MSYVADTLSNLIHQTAFFNLTWGNYLMILVACVFLYLAIRKGFEPLLLVPIAFGMLLVNIYPDIMYSAEEASNGAPGLFHVFYILDEWSILPSLIFMGVGAMTDFGPLIANPKSFLLGAAAQLGIYVAYFLAIFLGLQRSKAAAAISIIGGADGPTSIFLAGKLGQTASDGTHRCGRLFLYVPGADHPAADHESSDHRERAEDQDGAASSGIQTGEDPLPGCDHHRCLPDPSDHRSPGWYADAW